jgi:Ca-activated chloride channel family protein
MMLDVSGLVPGLRFANPAALLLLLAVPPWLFAARRRQSGLGGLTFPGGAWLRDVPAGGRVKLAALPDVLRAVALALLIVALARPQRGHQVESLHQKGIDIMLALDLSGSMMAEDVKPNRVEAAKATLVKFLSRLQSDRCGLVMFAGRSFTAAPLTTDYEVLASIIKKCRVGTVNVGGTAIGDALANCLYRLISKEERERLINGGDEESADEAPPSRVIVLLTDGENNSGEIEPFAAADMCRRFGVRVHCIGLGSLSGAHIPIYENGRKTFLMNGNEVYITRMDETELREIARRTGGDFHRAQDATTLDQVYQKLAAMEKHRVEVRRLTRHEERYADVLVLALLVLLLELLLRATWLRVEL